MKLCCRICSLSEKQHRDDLSVQALFCFMRMKHLFRRGETVVSSGRNTCSIPMEQIGTNRETIFATRQEARLY